MRLLRHSKGELPLDYYEEEYEGDRPLPQEQVIKEENWLKSASPEELIEAAVSEEARAVHLSRPAAIERANFLASLATYKLLRDSIGQAPQDPA